MSNYKAIYRNTGLLPRSINEAERNATYATAIQRPSNDELRDALDFFGGLLVSVVYIGLGAGVAVGALMFFGVVVIK